MITSFFTTNVSGDYSFRTLTDDGVRLYIDGQIIIDHWQDQAPNNQYATINLSSGLYECVMEYYENGGGANASLYWTPPGQAESLVLQNEPVEDADAIFITKLTDSDGRVNFLWNEYQEGELYVTATKRNYRPHEGSIAINNLDGYAIVPDYENLNDSLNPGETINFNIPLSNNL